MLPVHETEVIPLVPLCIAIVLEGLQMRGGTNREQCERGGIAGAKLELCGAGYPAVRRNAPRAR